MPVTLEQLLQSRDNRVKHQKDLLGAHPGRSLLCLTVQLPGPEKRNRFSLAIAREGVEAIREAFRPEYEELRDLETGFEGYFMVPLLPADAKRIACRIEDTHPLGRLMDIDVVADGPISREELGLEPRKCLLCDQPARYCMRARTHTVSELQERIGQLLEGYL